MKTPQLEQHFEIETPKGVVKMTIHWGRLAHVIAQIFHWRGITRTVRLYGLISFSLEPKR